MEQMRKKKDECGLAVLASTELRLSANPVFRLASSTCTIILCFSYNLFHFYYVHVGSCKQLVVF
jgi:hypothetical protein